MFYFIDKLDSFKNTFVTIASLHELPLLPFPLFCWYRRKLFPWAIAATQTAKNQVWMRVKLEQDRTLQITVSNSRRKSDHLGKVSWDWLKITTDFSKSISPSEKFNQSLWWKLKSRKISTLLERLMKKILSMLLLDEIASKTVLKVEDNNSRDKESKILKQRKPVRDINKNPHGIINMQKKVPFSQKL